MVRESMKNLGKKSSVIREIFEYAKKRKAEIGAENVYDFSIGNPSVPPPAHVGQVMTKLLSELDPVMLHGYTSAVGDPAVRHKIAETIKQRFSFPATEEWIYMTCGAAASLTITLGALINEGDELIVLAPFFPEYRVFAEQAGATVKTVECRAEDFQIDFNALEPAITAKTKAIIVNSPNNPTGVVFSRNTIEQLSLLLQKKQQEFDTDIYIIADEPYRELVYDNVTVPYIPNFYDNTVVCYSYSKSLSLPGERIGYIFVSPLTTDANDLYAAVCGAGRALGFVCAPSLLQHTIAQCATDVTNLEIYDTNRKMLYDALTDYGYTVVRPEGAFYLFVKALEPDANAFCARAKKQELLLVPSDDFGFPGYVRIAYCVQTVQIEQALPAFKKLYRDYKENEA